MRRGSIFWGILVIGFGILLLLDNLGYLGNIDVWRLIWPVFLIALGGWILLGVYFKRPGESEYIEVPLDGAQQAHMRLQHGAGKIQVTVGTAPGNLVEGEIIGGLDLDKRQRGDVLDVRLKAAWSGFPFDWSPGQTMDWNLRLNRDVPMSLELETGASDARLDLSDLQISELVLKSGASSTTLTLPSSADYTRVKIEAGVASVKIEVPDGVAARINSRSGLSSMNVSDQRFPKTGDRYESTDYAHAENKVEIDVEMGVGSVVVV